MRVIIIAAGSSTRLAKETIGLSKGLLEINGKSIIEIQLDLFKKNQLSNITIITGPNKEQFKFQNVNYVEDNEFQNHDVLGSLMVCKPIMDDEILTTKIMSFKKFLTLIKSGKIIDPPSIIACLIYAKKNKID